MNDRVELWSCGGGRQSAGIAALIVEGQLPRPDHVCMVAIEWEMKSTFRYVCDYIRPAMQSLGIPFTFIPRKKYALHDFWGGADGQSVLLPVHSDQSGKASKLPEWCSGEWKRDVVMRWSAEQPDWKKRGVNNWVGISFDEQNRRRSPKRKWFQPVYPLLDMRVTRVSGCLAAVERVGWPDPPRSRCRHCPNQSDGEWLELSKQDWDEVCDLEDELRKTDPNLYFHRSLQPLRMVELKPSDEDDGLFGGCSSGMCF